MSLPTASSPQKRAAASATGLKNTLSVVFSFRNEEDVLEELIRRTRAVLDHEVANGRLRDYELVFVNDDSLDRSQEILEQAAVGHHDIRIVTMSRNFGCAACQLAGMEYASGDGVVYMDADLQDPPEVIPDLITVWQNQNVDVVHTVRLSREGEGRVKMALTWLGYRIISLVSDVKLQVQAGDFKLLSRRAVNQLVQLREKLPYVRGLTCWIGFNQATVKYRREARAAGKTKFPVLGRKVIQNFLSSALIAFSDIPLQLSLFIGAIAVALSMVLGVYVVIQRFLINVTSGWTSLMVTVLFIGGIQLMMIGVLGLYLHSVYLDAKNRPNYIVESCQGFEHRLDQADETEEPKQEEANG